MEENKPALQLDLDIQGLEESVMSVEEKIDSMTSHADALDYTIAAASGVLTGLIDNLLGKWDLEEGREWADEQTNKFVTSVAKFTGYKGDDLKGAITHLEKNFGAPSDSVTKKFGGGSKHHLRDFAHHASLIGLFFSVLTQFTSKAYGIDEFGCFKVECITNTKYIGKTFSSKLLLGIIFWLLHLASDMAGTNKTAGEGTGITGPFLSLAQLLASCPIFKDKNGVNQLSKKISKLFDGTYNAKLDEKGNFLRNEDGEILGYKLDLRGELGIAHQVGKQLLPVAINEIVVRAFYFVRCLINELKSKQSIKEIDWNNTNPFGNRTVERMITVATASFSAVDIIGATIQSAIKPNPNGVFVYINYIGLIRVSVSLGTEAVMEYKKKRGLDERMRIKAELLYTMRAKLLYQEKLLWTACEDADKSIAELSMALTEAMPQIQADLAQISTATEEIATLDAESLEEKNPGLTQDILDLI